MTTIRLDDDQLEQLALIAGFEGRSVSDEIREAVTLFIEEKRQDSVFLDRVNAGVERLIGRPN